MPRKTKQNEITSPELLNQVNPDNVRLKQDFIAYLQSVQRSPKTIAGYSNDIDIFWVWNLQNNGNKFFPKIWWERLDLNQRSPKAADLQSAVIDRSTTLPKYGEVGGNRTHRYRRERAVS